MKPLIQAGKLGEDALYAELGEIAAGKKPGRESEDERIFGLPVGIGAHDICLAQVNW
jgi:ornithine cyclodeaminase